MTPDKQSEPPARRALREAEGLLFENSRCTTSDVPIGAGRSIHTIQLKLRDDERGAPALVMLPGYGLGAGAFFMVFEAFAAVAPRDAVPFGSVSVSYTHLTLPTTPYV